MELSNRVAAVTGAGSGIGRGLAVELTRRGAHVAISDIDESALASTVAACEGHGVKVTSSVVDVSDRQAVHDWADAVVDEHGRASLIINNAGVALMAPILTMRHEDLEWLMGINFWGVVHGTEAFLPHLVASGEGHVVNISSVFGLTAIPSQAAYNAAKFAVRGYTDALRIELDIAKAGVSATTVHPGGVKTNIARNARSEPDTTVPVAQADRFERMARTTPEAAARQILDGVEKNRRRVLVGPDAKVFDLLSRLPAGVTQRIMVSVGGRELRRADRG